MYRIPDLMILQLSFYEFRKCFFFFATLIAMSRIQELKSNEMISLHVSDGPHK